MVHMHYAWKGFWNGMESAVPVWVALFTWLLIHLCALTSNLFSPV